MDHWQLSQSRTRTLIGSLRAHWSRQKIGKGFSLVEILIAVALIGILVFLALPNIVQVKDDSETHLAIARAEALNMAMASLVQAKGTAAANVSWTAAGVDNDARYALIAPYLAFAPNSLTNYTPGGYGITFPSSLSPLTKVTLKKGNATIDY